MLTSPEESPEDSPIIENREITENETDIQAIQLDPDTNFGCEASREASDVLTSPEESPEVSPEDFPIIENLPHKSSLHFQAYAANLDLPSHRTPNQIIDSGSTNYIYHDKEEFTEYESYYRGITIADGITVQAKGRSTVQYKQIVDNGSIYIINIKDILYMLNLAYGLFSLSQVIRNSLRITFFSKGYYIYKGNIIIGSTPKVNNTYILSIFQSSTKIAILIQENIRVLITSVIYNAKVVELWYY